MTEACLAALLLVWSGTASAAGRAGVPEPVPGSRLGSSAASEQCPGQMGVDDSSLSTRFLGAVGAPSSSTVAHADAPAGSAIFSGVVPAAVCASVAALAAPLLEPAVQKRDSVDGEPEFQLDLLEPDDPATGQVRRLRDLLTRLKKPLACSDPCRSVAAAEGAGRDSGAALAAAGAAPTPTAPPDCRYRRRFPAHRLA